jgi:hypothetical protein
MWVNNLRNFSLWLCGEFNNGANCPLAAKTGTGSAGNGNLERDHTKRK